jgi:hypothetical protein
MKKIVCLFLLLLFTTTVNADEHKEPGHIPGGGLSLPPELKELLKQEMIEVRKGMESLVFAITSGDWHKIEETGHNIKNSYILKKSLTEHQRHQLHEALPERFRELDMKFHYYAGMLSHVAKEKDMELVNFYVYKMNEACTSCHAKYASDTFTGFKQKNRHARHDH